MNFKFRSILVFNLVFSIAAHASYSATNNVKVPFTDKKALNLFTHRYKKDQCYIVKKMGVELTRAAKSMRGSASDCHRFDGDHWLVRDSEKETVFLVPFERVSDVAFPFFYEKLVKNAKTPQPKIKWVQFYQNNIYKGVYLRVEIPFDKTKKAERVGPRRNLLFISGDKMVYVDTKMRERTDIYSDYSSQAKIFSVVDHDPSLLQLQMLKNNPEVSFILEKQGQAQLYVTPVPVPTYYERVVGQFKEAARDGRFLEIQNKVNSDAAKIKLSPGLAEGYAEYLAELKKMVEVESYLKRKKLDWEAIVTSKTWSHTKVTGT